MRKVKLKNHSTKINVDDLNDTHIIGIKFKDGEKSGIAKLRRDEYISVGFSTKNSDYDSIIVKDTIAMLIDYLYNDLKSVYIFESRKELLKWLIK